MIDYESNTALYFVLFAVGFTLVFGLLTWRVIRNLAKEDEETAADVSKTNRSAEEHETHEKSGD